MTTASEVTKAPQTRISSVGAVSVVAVGLAIVVGFGLFLGRLGNNEPLLKAKIVGRETTSSGVVTLATLDLATYPDSMAGEHGASGGAHPDWVSYGPSTNIWVPANAIVRVTIRNYDSATPLNSAFYASVQGTVGGDALFNGVAASRVNAADVAHTFTIHTYPTAGQPLLDVSVPLPGVAGNAPNAPGSNYPAPSVVTFSFRTGSSGRYVWQCFDPCGGSGYYAGFGGPMQTLGYMAGTLTVGGGNNA